MEKPFIIISVPHEWYICFHIFSFYHSVLKITVCNCALGPFVDYTKLFKK